MSSFLENNIYLIGGDVSNSKSRAIHEAIYNHLNLNLAYVPKNFSDKNSLEKFLNEKRQNLISNVTYPYKQFCFEYFKNTTSADDASKFCGACNLIIGNKQIYNLDGPGFVEFAKIENISLTGKNVLICGPGATAHSIYFAIKDHAKVSFASRNPKSWKENDIEVIGYETANEKLKSFDLVIDARPISYEENLIDVTKINSSAVVVDISYSDKKTGIVKAANDCGIKTYDGKTMLVCQAVLCIKKILSALEIDNAEANDFKKLYNIGAQAIGL